MTKYLLYRIALFLVIPLLIAFFLIDFVVPIAFILSIIALMLVFMDSEMTDRLSTGALIYLIFFVMFIMLINTQVVSIINFVKPSSLAIRPLALEKPFERLLAFDTSNAIIAGICMMGSFIFWILGFITGRGKKVILGLGFIVATIYLIESLYIFMNPQGAAMNIGWYRATIDWFNATQTFGALQFLLTPLTTLAVLEYYFMMSMTLIPAIVVCFFFYFVNDFIATKFGVDVEAQVRRLR